MDDVEVCYGDTDIVRCGVGTYASRTRGRSAATAVRNAADSVRDKALDRGGQPAGGRRGRPGAARRQVVGRQGSPGGPRCRLADVAAAVAPGQPLPEGVDDYGLEATDVFHPETNTFAYGMHVATVEVDIETGIVKLLRPRTSSTTRGPSSIR